jgi:predicted GNAT superfamily acetyltransferase
MVRESEIAIRDVHSPEEYLACETLQARAFGYADRDIVPKNELISIARAGGLVLGAFEGARLAGFCFGFVGREHRSGALYHSSRMVAVDPADRRRGIALRLKLAQRDAVLAQGMREIRWTFDPDQAPNATLNLRKLGAVATGLVRDCYGRTREGRPTDRLLVSWRLDRPRRTAPPGAVRIFSHEREALERAFSEGLEAVDFEDGRYLMAPADRKA